MPSQKAGLLLMVACATQRVVMGQLSQIPMGLPPHFSFAWSETDDQACNPPVKPDPTCMCWLYESATGELQNYAQWFCNHQYPNGRPQIQAGQFSQNAPNQQGQLTQTLQMPSPQGQFSQNPQNLQMPTQQNLQMSMQQNLQMPMQQGQFQG